MQENESVLLTAEGKNGKVELTAASVRISEYKKGLMGWNRSKIDKIHEIPRDLITRAEVSQGNFYLFPPEGFQGVDFSGFFHISFDEGYRPDFDNIAEEIGLQGRWYEDNNKLSNVVTYDNENHASIDANRAAKRGWKVLGSSATDGHFNVGRTLAKTVLTGGVGLMLSGASRTKGKFTITYERTPEWLASNNKEVSQPLTSTHVADPQPAEDSLQKMKQLKEMLDAGLISESEYNTKKADLLSKM
jgi:hypothetical protein